MPSGNDPYLRNDKENQTIELGMYSWYEDCTAFASGENDYVNYNIVHKLNYKEFFELLKEEKLDCWKVCIHIPVIKIEDVLLLRNSY